MAAPVLAEDEQDKSSAQKLQKLEQQLQEAEQGRQELERRLQGAEQERQEEKQRRQEAERAQRQLQEEIAPLSFRGLLTRCHQILGQILVETNRLLCTTGGIGKPENKLVPTEFRRCTDFIEKQNQIFSQVDDIHQRYQGAPMPFYPRYFIQRICDNSRPLANEQDLRKQQGDCVEEIVRSIIQDLIDHRKPPDHFHLGTNCRLESHPKLLMAGEEKSTPSNAKYVDKTYILQSEGADDRLVFIIEYKAPHKLTLETLESGLDGLSKLSFTSLVNRAKTSNDPELKAVETAEKKVATAIAQVYTYMIESGLRYGYLTTGQAFVFLNIDPVDWNTLYYHSSVPYKDASPNGNEIQIARTAIGEVLSFYIRACGAEVERDQEALDRNKANALKWQIDEDTRIAGMTPSPTKQSPESSAYKANKAKAKRPAQSPPQSPLPPRQSRKLRSSGLGETPPVDTLTEMNDSDDSPDGDSGPALHSTASRPGQASRASKGSSSRGGKGAESGRQASGSSRKRHENYCSHQCLLSLATHGALDPSCPNYEFHPRRENGKGGSRHAIDVWQLRELLVSQLQRDRNHNIDPLNLKGARGIIFKLTLESHGYTMIGKGTPPYYVSDLQQEEAVYRHLQEIQGTHIPVCLGAIESPKRYFYIGTDIYYWLLLSFGGQSLTAVDFEARELEVHALKKVLYDHGLWHEDVRPANVLWDERAERLMMIDFERLECRPWKVRGKGVKKQVAVFEDMDPRDILRKRKAEEYERDIRPAEVRVL